MAGPQPTVIKLSDRQQRALKHLLRRQTSPQRLVRRVNIILTAVDGSNNEQIAKRLGLHRESVRHWRECWLSAATGLAAVEAKESDDKPLAEAIEAVLADAYRSGAPSCFSAEQIVTDHRRGVRGTAGLRLAHHALDAPRLGRRSRQSRHRRAHFSPQRRAFFKIKPISSRI